MTMMTSHQEHAPSSPPTLESLLCGFSPKSPTCLPARVLYDFSPQEATEIAVKANQEVYARYNANGWVFIKTKDQKRGYIPLAFCSLSSTAVGVHKVHRPERQLSRICEEKMPESGRSNENHDMRDGETCLDYSLFEYPNSNGALTSGAKCSQRLCIDGSTKHVSANGVESTTLVDMDTIAKEIREKFNLTEHENINDKDYLKNALFKDDNDSGISDAEKNCSKDFDNSPRDDSLDSTTDTGANIDDLENNFGEDNNSMTNYDDSQNENLQPEVNAAISDVVNRVFSYSAEESVDHDTFENVDTICNGDGFCRFEDNSSPSSWLGGDDETLCEQLALESQSRDCTTSYVTSQTIAKSVVETVQPLNIDLCATVRNVRPFNLFGDTGSGSETEVSDEEPEVPQKRAKRKRRVTIDTSKNELILPEIDETIIAGNIDESFTDEPSMCNENASNSSSTVESVCGNSKSSANEVQEKKTILKPRSLQRRVTWSDDISGVSIQTIQKPNSLSCGPRFNSDIKRFLNMCQPWSLLKSPPSYHEHMLKKQDTKLNSRPHCYNLTVQPNETDTVDDIPEWAHTKAYGFLDQHQAPIRQENFHSDIDTANDRNQHAPRRCFSIFGGDRERHLSAEEETNLMPPHFRQQGSFQPIVAPPRPMAVDGESLQATLV